VRREMEQRRRSSSGWLGHGTARNRRSGAHSSVVGINIAVLTNRGAALFGIPLRCSLETRHLFSPRDTWLRRIRARNRARARTIADSLGALKRPWLFGANTFRRAAILGVLGERGFACAAYPAGESRRAANGELALHGGARFVGWHPAFAAFVRPRD
jgi:hypothetical protein